jgi:hypothetical protein
MEEETEKPELSVLDKAKAEREAIEKATASAKAEADRLEKLKSEQLLSGTAGARVEPAAPKVETAKEYAARVERGDFNKK